METLDGVGSLARPIAVVGKASWRILAPFVVFKSCRDGRAG
jgi:hypothetical protein